MSPEDLKNRNIEKEFVFSTSRSSGPGGQNVNKVSTKVELRFSFQLSEKFSEEEKALLAIKLSNKITKDNEIVFVSQSERTQMMNKIVVIEKFYNTVSRVLTIQKKRRATKPTLSSQLKRLEKKRSRGNIKKLRKDSRREE